jgi:hypothetical protein
MRTTARTFAENPEKHLAVMRARGVPEDKLERMKAFGTTILQQEVEAGAEDEAADDGGANSRRLSVKVHFGVVV